MDKVEFNKLNNSILNLTDMEKKVYDALVESQFATGIFNDQRDVQTDLKNSLKASGVTPQQFAGIIGSLTKKELYHNVLFDGGFGLPFKTIEIDGKKEKVRTDIGSVVVLDEEYEQSLE